MKGKKQRPPITTPTALKPQATHTKATVKVATRFRQGRTFRYVVYAILGLCVLAATYWRVTQVTIPRPGLTHADVRLQTAIDEAESHVHSAPRSAQAWGDLAELLMAHQFFTEAAQCFHQAAECDNTNWRWPYAEALALKIEHPREAIAAAQASIARDESQSVPRLLCGELMAGVGRYEEALEQFQQVLADTPHNARAQLGLARVFVAQQKSAAALPVLTDALKHPSTRRAALRCKAQIEMQLNDSTAARQSLAAAAQLPADSSWPDEIEAAIQQRRIDRQGYLARVSALQGAGRIDEAKRVAREAEQLYPELYLLVVGRVQLEKGALAQAETSLQGALAIKPAWAEALLSLGQAQARQQQSVEAEATYRQLLAAEPAHGPALLELGELLDETRATEKTSLLESAARYMPRSAAAHRALATWLTSQGQTSQARHHAKVAAELSAAATPDLPASDGRL